jgi:hypothetical protein
MPRCSPAIRNAGASAPHKLGSQRADLTLCFEAPNVHFWTDRSQEIRYGPGRVAVSRRAHTDRQLLLTGFANASAQICKREWPGFAVQPLPVHLLSGAQVASNRHTTGGAASRWNCLGLFLCLVWFRPRSPRSMCSSQSAVSAGIESSGVVAKAANWAAG